MGSAGLLPLVGRQANRLPVLPGIHLRSGRGRQEARETVKRGAEQGGWSPSNQPPNQRFHLTPLRGAGEAHRPLDGDTRNHSVISRPMHHGGRDHEDSDQN
jgi:hypothetical protein